MFFIRKIGKFLRGNATPLQLISASVLGGLLGSFPGLAQGPLLFVLLLLLLVVLNANLLVAGLTLLLAKMVTLILLPILFKAGVVLLESPLGGLVAPLVNAPVTAWFGLDYYVMIPSLMTGLLLGLLVGIGLVKGLGGFRRKMAGMEEGSEKFQRYTNKGWVKALAWVLFGGLKGKKSWSELSQAKGGLPVRPIGLVLVAGLTVLLWVGLQFLDSTIATAVLRDELGKLNGATVDVRALEIEAGNSSVRVTELAMADPADLGTNRFAAEAIQIDISAAQLLAKKFVLDKVEVTGARTGGERRVRGELVLKDREAEEELEEEAPEEEAIALTDYLERGSKWQGRLQTARRLYDKLAPQGKEAAGEDGEAAKESWQQRLERRAREAGYASMQAEGLIRSSPRLRIRELVMGEIRSAESEAIFAVTGRELSTQPQLVEERGELRIRRKDGGFSATVGLPYAGAPATSEVALEVKELSVEELEESAGRDLPMDGGSLSIRGSGSIAGNQLDIPLEVVLRDTTLTVAGQAVSVSKLPMEVGLVGSLGAPRLALDREALQDAAVDAAKEAGKEKLKNEIEEKAGDKLKGLFPFGD